MNERFAQAVCDLWHISRTALAGSETSKYHRMLYISKELKRSYPELIQGMSNKKLWLAIEDELEGTF